MDDKGGTMARGFFGRYLEWIGIFMRSENLDELPEAPLDPERTSFIFRLLKSESLPFDDVVAGGQRPALLSGFLASEPLPLDDCPKPRDGRASFIARLFSRESLLEDPIPGPGSVSRGHGR